MSADWSYVHGAESVGYVAIRKRGWVRMVIGTMLTGAGLAATIVGFLEVSTTQAEGIRNNVGVATVPGGTVTFESNGGPYTIFLLTPRIFTNDEEVERQVGSTQCEVLHPDGDDSTIKGAFQGASVTTDAGATVGWFTARPGTTTVTCDYVRSERTPRDFAVGPGKPEAFGPHQQQLWGGILALTVGIPLMIWGWRGKTVVTRTV